MFINILLDGYRLLENEQNSGDDDENSESFRQSRILGIAQDVVFTASGDKNFTRNMLDGQVIFIQPHDQMTSLTCFIKLVML